MTMTLSGDGAITGLVAGGLPDATIQTADIVDGAVTAAKLDTAASFSGTKTTTGIQKLPNGLIIQWGNTAITANGQAVSFGSAFPVACLNVSVTPNVGSAPSANNLVGINGLTTTQFNIWFGTAQSIYWVAIGY